MLLASAVSGPGIGTILPIGVSVPDTILGPVGGEEQPPVRLTKPLRRTFMRRFTTEGRHRRQQFRVQLQREWESQVAPRYDQEDDDPDGAKLLDEEIFFDGYMHQRLARFDDDLELAKEDFIETLYYAALPGSSCFSRCSVRGKEY